MIICPVCKTVPMKDFSGTEARALCRCGRLFFVPSFGRSDGHFRFYHSAAAGATNHLIARWDGLYEFVRPGPVVRIPPESMEEILKDYVDTAVTSCVLTE